MHARYGDHDLALAMLQVGPDRLLTWAWDPELSLLRWGGVACSSRGPRPVVPW